MGMLRRSLLMAALIFWLGGLAFYGAVVVPVGRSAIGATQSLVTRDVAFYLNLITLVAIPFMAWDLLAGRDPSAARRRLRWFCCANALLTLVALVWLRSELVAHMASGTLGSGGFRSLHQAFVAVGAWQWWWGAAYVVSMLYGWRAEDQQQFRLIGSSNGEG